MFSISLLGPAVALCLHKKSHNTCRCPCGELSLTLCREPYLELVIWSFSGVWSLVLGAFRSSCKELLNLMHHFRKALDFRFRVVEIEARTRSRFYAELPHQPVRAV